MPSPWLSAPVDVDPIARARLLRRAHAAVFNGLGRPLILRQMIIDSWQRSTRAGVDPTRPAPRIVSEAEAAARLSSHRLAEVVPIVRTMLGAVARDARHIVAISDADGLLMSAEGHPEMLRAAATTHFLPGALLTESAVGTNAVGTALYLDHPLQIFAAEHFNRLFHGWTCSAAPIHDPDSGALLGTIDLSGNFRTAHPHSMSLVAAVARLAESQLALEAQRRDAYLRDRYIALVMRVSDRPSALVTKSGRVVVSSPPSWLPGRLDMPAGADRFALPEGDEVAVEAIENGNAFLLWKVGRAHAAPSRPKLRLHALGRRRMALEQIGVLVELTPRHSEILTLLALHPDGVSGDELAREIYTDPTKTVTIRAEMSRLRRLLGCLVLSNPYRLVADVRADFLDVERLVRVGDVDTAVRRYTGPLLCGSSVPGIVEARERLERALGTRDLDIRRDRSAPGYDATGPSPPARSLPRPRRRASRPATAGARHAHAARAPRGPSR
jgi:hypothetical protein